MDLFAFLEEDAINVPQKRKTTSAPSQVVQDSQLAHQDSSKKARLSSPNPLVLDDFETEARREIEASAGLTGTAEAGAMLELRHQVSKSI